MCRRGTESRNGRTRRSGTVTGTESGSARQRCEETGRTGGTLPRPPRRPSRPRADPRRSLARTGGERSAQGRKRTRTLGRSGTSSAAAATATGPPRTGTGRGTREAPPARRTREASAAKPRGRTLDGLSRETLTSTGPRG